MLSSLVQAFLHSPGETGSVIRSSRHLARRVAAEAFASHPRLVLEVGAGDGAITEALVARARKARARVVALDVNVGLLASNRTTAALVQADAAHLPVKRADVIVCSLPFASLPVAKVQDILAALAELSDRVVLYQYTKRRFEDLAAYFPRLKVVDRVFFNLPPAYVLATPR